LPSVPRSQWHWASSRGSTVRHRPTLRTHRRAPVRDFSR
jgi:hypothetical protein